MAGKRACLAVGIILTFVQTVSLGALPAAAPVSHPRYAKKLHIEGVSDAGKVNDYLYRGTQPNEKGLKHLRKLGIDTIVDLRGEFHHTMENERRHAAKLGMRLVLIPGNGWSPPKDEQIAEFFALIDARPRRKIYVHCWLGGDRSGVFLAAYRIAFDGWTPEHALAEMREFKYHGFWHPAMTAYVRDFPARLRRSPTLARYRHGEAEASEARERRR
jgi:protein-tyrosine phosphatase